MYERVNVDDVEARDLEGFEPRLRSVGYELRPAESRPNVWEYEAGDAFHRHRHESQEELYLVLSGRFEMTVEDETFELAEGDVVVVPPESWRSIAAVEDGRIFVYGAPPVEDDSIRDDGE